MTARTRELTESIATEYAGTVFRSRLEARWAVFLDVAGIEWQYEPRAIAVPVPRKHRAIGYLPDFWLPEARQIAEVKGFMPPDNFRRLLDIAHGTSWDIAVLGHMPGGFDSRWPVQLHHYNGNFAPHGLYAIPWSPHEPRLERGSYSA